MGAPRPALPPAVAPLLPSLRLYSPSTSHFPSPIVDLSVQAAALTLVLVDVVDRGHMDVFAHIDGATFFSTGADGPTAFRFNPHNAEDIFTEFFSSSSPFGGLGGGMDGMGGGHGLPSGGVRFASSMFGSDEDAFSQSFSGGAQRYPRMFGGRGGGGRAVKMAPIEMKLPCSLEELYKGTTKKMKISREIADDSGRQFRWRSSRRST